MANRDIKKESKKKKRADTGTRSLKPIMPEPEIVKKAKKKDR